MMVITALVAAIDLAIVVAYAVLGRPSSRATIFYLQSTVAVLVVILTVSVLRLSGALGDDWLLSALLLALLVAIPTALLVIVQREHREERQLRLLQTAATMLMPTVELDVLLNQILDLVHAAVRADSSAITLLDEKTRELRFGATRRFAAAHIGDYRVSIDHPAVREVWDGRGPIIVPDVEQTPRFRQLIVRPGARSFFGIPMVARDKLVGFLNIHRTQVSMLEPDEIEVLTALASQAAVAISLAHLYADQQRRYLETVSALASAIEVNDPNTIGHSRRVTLLCKLLAEELGLDPQVQDDLEVSALLHDIGKIGVSNRVLRKPGKLNAEERDEVRTHPVLGALVLREVETLANVVPSVLYHHERWDGQGYPSGLSGSDIPIAARVVAVADAFEVMTAGRPYREPRSPDDALAELKREAGGQFDPEVVSALERLYRRGGLEQVLTPVAVPVATRSVRAS